MQTLQRAIAEIRDLEAEELDLVSGAALSYTTSETQTPCYTQQTVAAYGNVYYIQVVDDMSTTTSYSLGWD